MDKKKSQTKPRSSAETAIVSPKKMTGTPRKVAEKPSKKISSSTAEKKTGVKTKVRASRTKAPARAKPTRVSPVKTSGEKNAPTGKRKAAKKYGIKKPLETAKITKTKLSKPKTAAKPATAKTSKIKKPAKVSEVKKALKEKISAKTTKTKAVPKKEPAKTLRISNSVTPAKKPAKKSPVKITAKTKIRQKKTFESVSTGKTSAKKVTKVAAKKAGLKTIKRIKTAAPSETKTRKEKKSTVATAKKAGPKVTPKKNAERVSATKPPAQKVSKVTAEKIEGKAFKGIKAAARAAGTAKVRKTAAKTLKASEKKSAIRENIPETKGKGKEKTALKRKETAEASLLPSRKTVKGKGSQPGTMGTPSFKTAKPLPAIGEKTAAMYIASPQAERKPKKSSQLKVFLPEEELPPEETQRAPFPQLPEEYGENELLLMEVDPLMVFVSWEIKPGDISTETGRLNLRVYDVTGINFAGSPAAGFFDIPLRNRVDSKFLDIKMPGRDVIMEIGLLQPEGTFKPIKRSNKVSMPALQTFKELGITGLLSDSDILIGY
jgi:hypothetical protein